MGIIWWSLYSDRASAVFLVFFCSALSFPFVVLFPLLSKLRRFLIHTAFLLLFILVLPPCIKKKWAHGGVPQKGGEIGATKMHRLHQKISE